MTLFKMEKNVKVTILIWHVVSEMVKKWVGQGFCLSCNYSWTICVLVKILLV